MKRWLNIHVCHPEVAHILKLVLLNKNNLNKDLVLGTSQYLFKAHMNSHFEHNCPHCDYTSRTEGRLKKHIKDFHTENEDGTSPNRTVRTTPGRPKLFRCKQCEFVSSTKVKWLKCL